MSGEGYIDFFKDQSLVRGLSDKELFYVTSRLTRAEYLPNDVIIDEGDKSTDLYIILEGEVSVQKWDEEHQFRLPLGILHKGDIFGEMSFMDESPRSSMIKAVKQTTVLKLSRKSLEKGSIASEELQSIENKLFSNIALANINRLRSSNKLFVKNLRIQLNDFQVRQDNGKLLIYQLMLLALSFIFSVFFAQGEKEYVPWLVALIPSILLIKSCDYSWKKLGLNFEGWQWTSIVSVITAGVVLCLIYFFYLAFHPLSGEPWIVTKTFDEFTTPFLTPFWRNCLFYIFYCISIELIARGVVQTTIQEFLEDYNGYKSIFIMACLVLLFQFPADFLSALFYLSSSLFLGYIRLMQKTIIGSFLVHYIVGIFINLIPS